MSPLPSTADRPVLPEDVAERLLPADDLAAVLLHVGRQLLLRDWAVDDHVGMALCDPATPDQPEVVLVPDGNDKARDTHIGRLADEFTIDTLGGVVAQTVLVQNADGAALLVSETRKAVQVGLLACTHCGTVVDGDHYDAGSPRPWCNNCCDDTSLWACEECGQGFREYDPEGDPNATTGHVNGSSAWCDGCHETEFDDMGQVDDALYACRTHDNECFVHGWDG